MHNLPGNENQKGNISVLGACHTKRGNHKDTVSRVGLDPYPEQLKGLDEEDVRANDAHYGNNKNLKKQRGEWLETVFYNFQF